MGASSDIEQVEYFWALLSEQRAVVREKLDRLNAALARSERGGHLSSVRRKRLLKRAMENDIRAIDHMLYALGNRLSASSNTRCADASAAASCAQTLNASCSP